MPGYVLQGNLREASGVVGKVRPGGVLVVDLLKNGDRALLVGSWAAISCL